MKSFMLSNIPYKKEGEIKSYWLEKITAMIGVTTKKVHIVTLNTIKFDSLIHPSIHRLDNHDQKTYLSVRIHIIENEEC